MESEKKKINKERKRKKINQKLSTFCCINY